MENKNTFLINCASFKWKQAQALNYTNFYNFWHISSALCQNNLLYSTHKNVKLWHLIYQFDCQKCNHIFGKYSTLCVFKERHQQEVLNRTSNEFLIMRSSVKLMKKLLLQKYKQLLLSQPFHLCL